MDNAKYFVCLTFPSAHFINGDNHLFAELANIANRDEGITDIGDEYIIHGGDYHRAQRVLKNVGYQKT